MAESTVSVDYQTLYKQAAKQGWGVNTHVDGTVTISSGVVTFTQALSTLTQGWAAAGALQVGTNYYTVNTYDSTTQVTLDDTSVTAAAGTAAILTQAPFEIHEQIRETIDAGLRTFRNAFPWDFLTPSTTLSTVAAYATGTITISSGVVTLSGGTFPSWSASGELIVSGTAYTVNTRDSDTQVTLDDTSVTVASATSYTIAQSDYDLPDNFASICGPLTYRPGDNTLGYRPINITSESRLRRERQRRAYTDRPYLAAIQVKTHDATTGVRYQIMFGPSLPDAVYQLRYSYNVRIDELTPANKYPTGGAEHSELIRCAVRAAVEAEVNDMAGVWQARYQQELENSIRVEQEGVPDYLGMNVGGDEGHVHQRRPFKGQSVYEGFNST